MAKKKSSRVQLTMTVVDQDGKELIKTSVCVAKKDLDSFIHNAEEGFEQESCNWQE